MSKSAAVSTLRQLVSRDMRQYVHLDTTLTKLKDEAVAFEKRTIAYAVELAADPILNEICAYKKVHSLRGD